MKFLTILVYTILLMVTTQVATAQTNNRSVEVLIVLATLSNIAGDIEKKSYPLPSGKVRTIYNFNSRNGDKKFVTQTTLTK